MEEITHEVEDAVMDAALLVARDVKEMFKDFLEWTLTPSAPIFIIGTLIVLLVPVFMHYYLAHTSNYIILPSIAVLGPAGAGKTALVAQLERRAAGAGPPVTRTSQVPSAVELAVTEDKSSSWRADLDAAGATAIKFLVVDTPGHGKLRAPTLARLTVEGTKSARLRAIVFMVDAGVLAADHDALAGAATYLYDILLALQRRTGDTRSSQAPYAIPVLVACNKADLFTALPAPIVRTRLEDELGRIRSARRRGLLDSSVGTDDLDTATAPGDGDDWLGQYGTDSFHFKQMREFDVEVDVIAGNVVGDGPGIDGWWSWMVNKI